MLPPRQLFINCLHAILIKSTLLFYSGVMDMPRLEAASLAANTPTAARQHNRRIIVHALRRFGGLSRADLSRLTGLTPQAIANIISTLMNDGLVRETGRRKSSRGQPPITIELSDDGGFALGLRIDATSYNSVSLSLTGEILSRDHGEVREGGVSILDLIADIYTGALRRHSPLPCFGMGVVTPGPFDTSWPGVPSPGSVAILQKSSVVLDLSKRLAAEVYLGNDAYAAAIGEKLYGCARDLNDFFYLYIGEGVGGGLVIGGESYRGTGGNGGEAGHLIIDPNGKPCYCGNRGCLGQYLSLASLREHGQEGWLRLAASSLRTAISTIENLFDPEAIVLGGSIPSSLLQSLANQLAELGPSVRQDHSNRVRLSELGEESPAFGASALPLYAK
jgi:predicted NBD/HSP70 family sugar kinase